MQTITIDAELFDRLQKAASSRGIDPDVYAAGAILDRLAYESVDDLTAEDWAAIDVGVQRGLKAADEGRMRPFKDYVADVEQRYGIRD